MKTSKGEPLDFTEAIIKLMERKSKPDPTWGGEGDRRAIQELLGLRKTRTLAWLRDHRSEIRSRVMIEGMARRPVYSLKDIYEVLSKT